MSGSVTVLILEERSALSLAESPTFRVISAGCAGPDAAVAVARSMIASPLFGDTTLEGLAKHLVPVGEEGPERGVAQTTDAWISTPTLMVVACLRQLGASTMRAFMI